MIQGDTRSLAPGAPSARALWALTHNSVRVPRACGDQSIHARTIIPFVFQEHTVTRASLRFLRFRKKDIFRKTSSRHSSSPCGHTNLQEKQPWKGSSPHGKKTSTQSRTSRRRTNNARAKQKQHSRKD